MVIECYKIGLEVKLPGFDETSRGNVGEFLFIIGKRVYAREVEAGEDQYIEVSIPAETVKVNHEIFVKQS